MAYIDTEGFLVHVYTDQKRKRVMLIGRLKDGRSFVASKSVPEPYICIYKSDASRAETLLTGLHRSAFFEETNLKAFDGNPCVRITSKGNRNLDAAVSLLRRNGLHVFGMDEKDANVFLTRIGIRAGINIKGDWRIGTNVDVVFPNAEITADNEARAPLFVLSMDIETEEPAGIIRAVGLSMLKLDKAGQEKNSEQERRERVLLVTGSWNGAGAPDPEIIVLEDEKSLLRTLVEKIKEMDPDIITGWNIIDFDFPRLNAAFTRHHMSFVLGRSIEAGVFFPSEKISNDEFSEISIKRSASVFLPGRQVLDGLRLVRSGFQSFDSYTLDAVAHEVLKKGKTVQVTDTEKLAELDRLYANDSLSFCRYCLNDAELVLDILEKRELIKYTVERAALTGAGIDKAWTSVVSFERVYAGGLYARGVLEPVMDPGRKVSGAAGGTVLDPLAGIFSNVAVYDFRSLYPSIIRTFNIDPLAYEQAITKMKPKTGITGIVSSEESSDFIRAPNGAIFMREPGILPGLIAEYFNERLAALARGDEDAAYVYKILMNSFYGVLGAPKCKYARTELAGAITSFGKICLHYARDFFIEKGYRVLYGDTDSVFVEMDKKGMPPGTRCSEMSAVLNSSLAEYIRKTYSCESFISIRYEKLYTKFFIPRLRSPSIHQEKKASAGYPEKQNVLEDERGRAKGYAGLLVNEDGSTVIDIKGMEAARSDYTPLAHRFQKELLSLLFRDGNNRAVEEYISDQITRLYKGEFDAELVFKKRLRREPESYVSSTPPHIKVARSLGWKHRRGTVEYIITVNGPEAISQRTFPVDYAWYAETQILPSARSVGQAAGFDADAIISVIHADGQQEFEWERK